MAVRTIFKYGIPLSFVYCTIYQNIWREGDEKLFEEQRRVWRDFFTSIDNGYHTTITKLNLSSKPSSNDRVVSPVSKFDSLDVRQCWNNQVIGAFANIDQVISNPKVTACKIYRKIQPYISAPMKKADTKTESNTSEG